MRRQERGALARSRWLGEERRNGGQAERRAGGPFIKTASELRSLSCGRGESVLGQPRSAGGAVTEAAAMEAAQAAAGVAAE